MHKFSVFIASAVVLSGAATAQGEIDIQQSHNQLLATHLLDLTQVHLPDWRVPEAMGDSRSEAVHVYRPIRVLAGGYTLGTVFAWNEGSWQPTGWRLSHPDLADETGSEQVFQRATDLPGRVLSRDPIDPTIPGLQATNWCTDAPDTLGPDSTSGHEVGDQARYSWTNETQGCAYETDFEVQNLPQGGIGWVVIDFRFELQNAGDDDDVGDDESY